MSDITADSVIRLIIVEDELPAREKLKMQLSQLPNVTLLAEFDNPTDAINGINELQPDVVLLDIELGPLNGFDVLDSLKHQPKVIFTTAYSKYAVDAFDQHAVDYLMKPFSLARLSQAIERIPVAVPQLETQGDNKTLVSRVGEKIHILQCDDITMIKSHAGLTSAWLADKEYIIDDSLEKLEHSLPNTFLRIHRNCIINKQHIQQLSRWSNGCYQVHFTTTQNTVNSSRNGAALLKQYFNL